MSAHHCIVLTAITIGILTPLFALYFFGYERPMTARTSRGQLSREILPGVRFGGSGMSEASVRWTALSAAILAVGLSIMVQVVGYVWWHGIAAYCFLWMGLFFIGFLGVIKPRFRLPIATSAMAFLPLVLAHALAWADYCGWLSFKVFSFHALTLLSAIIFGWVAITRIPDDGQQNHQHVNGQTRRTGRANGVSRRRR